jgi:hypothetical protein
LKFFFFYFIFFGFTNFSSLSIFHSLFTFFNKSASIISHFHSIMDIQKLLCVEYKNNGLKPSKKTRSQSKSSNQRKPWSEHEDYLLKKGYSKGLSWAAISSMYLPDRSRGCCWGRFKTLQMKSCKRTNKQDWSDSEDNLLNMSIKKHEGLFKKAWSSVAQELNTRDWKECQVRYNRMPSPLRRCRALMD